MNKKQRIKNRTTAKWLRHQQKCPECGDRGLHWVGFPMSILDILSGRENVGFWTCAKFYGPDGRRIGA